MIPSAPATSALVWFRRDLRLADNPAWAAATNAHQRVVALYVLDDVPLRGAGPHRLLQHTAELHALDQALQAQGGRLLVRRGDPTLVVAREAQRTEASAVYWNDDVSPYAHRRDEAVRATLGVPVESWWGHLVLPPGSVRAGAGHVHKVFGAFHRVWQATPLDPWPAAREVPVADDPGDGLPPLRHAPPVPAGSDAAHLGLARFSDRTEEYPEGRNDLAHPVTSGLSVALHYGTISPRHVVATVGTDSPGAAALVRQLAWRDWYAHLLHEQPRLVHHPMRPEFARIPWSSHTDDVTAWKTGTTGFPLVDAGMRELAATGAMHNRARMVTASFLVKDLMVDWRVGERHFRRLLIDADLAQNVGNWQWVAGTGPDAAPFFRIFNPVTQSRSHDPRGHYLRRWLPELAGLDDTAIHAPWEAGPLDLAAAGVTLGDTYPLPIVDHATARHEALAAYAEARA